MDETVAEPRRSLGSIVLGALLIVAGLVILGHTFIATVLSVLLIAWVTLLSGVVAVVAAFFRIGRGGFWSTVLSGALLIVLGLVFLRNTAATAVTLTLVAGALFLAIGITRLVAAVENDTHRWVLLVGGIASTLLGVIVIFNFVEATFTLLGVLVAVQTLTDGVTLLVVGQPHARRVAREQRPEDSPHDLPEKESGGRPGKGTGGRPGKGTDGRPGKGTDGRPGGGTGGGSAGRPGGRPGGGSGGEPGGRSGGRPGGGISDGVAPDRPPAQG